VLDHVYNDHSIEKCLGVAIFRRRWCCTIVCPSVEVECEALVWSFSGRTITWRRESIGTVRLPCLGVIDGPKWILFRIMKVGAWRGKRLIASKGRPSIRIDLAVVVTPVEPDGCSGSALISEEKFTMRRYSHCARVHGISDFHPGIMIGCYLCSDN
jgi:hypothetical protein